MIVLAKLLKISPITASALVLGAWASWASGPLPSISTQPRSAVVRNVAVFGRDDRAPLPHNLKTLENSIGLVTSAAERTLCTGFCVGRRTVATAAHCLFRTAGERKPDLSSFQFVVGSRGDRRSTFVTGRRDGSYAQHVIAGSTSLNVSPPIDATSDWALMRLAQPVCREHSLVVDDISPLRVEQLGARGRLLHTSFHGDLNKWSLALSQPCKTKIRLDASARRQIERDFSDTSTLVLHECDTGLASSGSPLLAVESDNSLRVVAINVGTYQQTRYLVTGVSVTRRYKPATVANTALSGSAFAKHILAFTRAEILNDHQSMSRLQTALNAHGFNAGAVDGLFGAQTRAAVIEFERSTGRAGIGLATPQLLKNVELYRIP
jgi:V8-like Glu-specific endopeptidase